MRTLHFKPTGMGSIVAVAILLAFVCFAPNVWGDVAEDGSIAWEEVNSGTQPSSINVTDVRATFEQTYPAPYGKTAVTFFLNSNADGSAAPIGVQIFTLGKTYRVPAQELEGVTVPDFGSFGIWLPGDGDEVDGELMVYFKYGPQRPKKRASIRIHINPDFGLQVLHFSPPRAD